LTEITKLIGQWITGSNNNNNAFSFQGKEKTTFLQKMTRYDQIASPELQSLFLDLVYHVFSDPTAAKERRELEGGFMMGLRSKDSAVRNNFFELFHKSIGMVLFFYILFYCYLFILLLFIYFIVRYFIVLYSINISL
jgi:hypothetical protein